MAKISENQKKVILAMKGGCSLTVMNVIKGIHGLSMMPCCPVVEQNAQTHFCPTSQTFLSLVRNGFITQVSQNVRSRKIRVVYRLTKLGSAIEL